MIYFFGSSRQRDDLLIVYKCRDDEGSYIRLRYYYDRLVNEYEDFQLSGGSEMNCVSIEGDLITYARKGDIKPFRTIIRVSISDLPENVSPLYVDETIAWIPSLSDDYQDREHFIISEVVGLQIASVNGNLFLSRTWLKSPHNLQAETYSLTEFLYMNNSKWEIIDNFYYNLTISDVIDSLLPDDIYQIPYQRVSYNGEFMYIGHMGRIMSFVNLR